MTESRQQIAAQLNSLLAESGLPALGPAASVQFEAYFELLLRWNQRMNLTAVRDPTEILRRHFLESIAVAHSLPAGISTLLDFGSGAGFPGLPIAICKPQIAVTLAESQLKKAAFLREAVRTVGIPVEVFHGRAEALARTFDCVVLRAVDRMGEAVAAAAALVAPSGWLALLTTLPLVDPLKAEAGTGLLWLEAGPFSSATSRVLVLGKKG